MSALVGVIVGFFTGLLSLFGVHPAPAPARLPDLSVNPVQQITQIDTIAITDPSAGDVLLADQNTIIRWDIPKTTLDSFPSDFDLYLFLNVQRQGQEGNVAGINDGANDPRAGSIVWNIPAYIASGQVQPGTYKISAYLQAEPKDRARLCVRSTGHACDASAEDDAIMLRSTKVHGETGWFIIAAPQASSSVAGMTKYTDSDFGFSFWYPSGWQVGDKYGANSVMFGDGVVKHRFDVGGPTGNISIMEITSPTASVYVGNEYYGYNTYRFDAVTHQWLDTIQNAANGSPDRTVPADVSVNTMGGLHMFDGGYRFGAATLIPLSAHNFLMVQSLDPGNFDQRPFARTVVATDPSVATPVSVAEQQTVIQAEADAYARR